MLNKTKGDPQKGIAVFKKLCAQCHKIYGEGQEVGPDLTNDGRANFDLLLSNVFDPSLVIGASYQATNVVTVQGRSLTGLLVEDGPKRVVLKLQGGKLETIPRGDVDVLSVSKVSLMPEDVEKQLKPQEIADLFAFLTLDQPPNDPAARRIPGRRIRSEFGRREGRVYATFFPSRKRKRRTSSVAYASGSDVTFTPAGRIPDSATALPPSAGEPRPGLRPRPAPRTAAGSGRVPQLKRPQEDAENRSCPTAAQLPARGRGRARR